MCATYMFVTTLLISPPEEYLVYSENHEAPAYLVAPPPSLVSSLIHALFSAPCYPTPSIFVLPLLLEKFSRPHKMINRVLSKAYLNGI